jgi:hypothetical protein
MYEAQHVLDMCNTSRNDAHRNQGIKYKEI